MTTSTVRRFLERREAPYELIEHRPTASSAATAAVAHVPPQRFAKAVVVEDDRRYLLVVIPAAHRVELGVLHGRFGRQVGLATEAEARRLFPDCEAGALPALGQAYGLDVLVDDALLDGGDVYLEAGDGTHLLRLPGPDFARLMQDAAHGRFSEAGPRRAASHAR
ncbi:MAG TPA: YbaK/EbsC family protein [Gammaproteobacteria bacterium]